MSNTFTNILPQLFDAARTVAQEPSGLISAITNNFSSKPVAMGDTIKIDVVPAKASAPFAAGPYAPTGDSTTAGVVTLTMAKNQQVSWNLTSEQAQSLQNTGIGQDWIKQSVAQAMRTLRNELESDIATAAYKGASRAYIPTAVGTTPFASDLSPLAEALKQLKKNGAPCSDLQFVGNTSVGANLRKLAVYQQAAQAGNDSQLRSGQFLPAFGFNVRESAGISTVSVGADSTAYKLNGAPSTGAVSMAIDTGVGVNTFANGTLVSFGSDSTCNSYVAGASGTSTLLTLNGPGLDAATTKTTGSTIVAQTSYTPAFAFERSAIVSVVRPPYMPQSPIVTTIPITDLVSGLTFLLVQSTQWGQISWSVHLAWGIAVVNSENLVMIAG